jgi:hypothetical protein
MKVFLLSLFGSALVAVIYGLVFAQREIAIREHLRTSGRGILRWLYVRALLGAVRGDAGVADSRNLAIIICLVLVVASSTASFFATDLQRIHKSNGVELERLYKDLTPSPPETPEKVRARLDAIKGKYDALDPQVALLTRVLRISGVILNAAFIVGWMAWIPYVKLRTRFAHEVARFSLRIQGLATPGELADLTSQELKVRDPESLRQYVELMRRVAAAKGIVGLTETFELWGRTETDQQLS